jgi:hypothetical protein
MRVIVEPAAKVGFRQLARLDLRAHRAVHHEDALAHEAGEETVRSGCM